MVNKRLVSVLMVGVLSVSSLAACSKSKVRKIEGASDDVNSFIGMMEEVYDMKGIAETASVKITSSVDGTAVDAVIKTDSLIDKSGNMSCTFDVDAKFGEYNVKGTIASLSYVENNIYIDLTGIYDIAKTQLGEAVIGMYLDQMQMSSDDLNKMLCFSIPTGDLKASDFNIAAVKDIAMLINDDEAKALTDANVVTKDGDKYTVKMTQDSAKTILSSFSDAFAANGDAIVDATFTALEKMSFSDKFASAANAVAGEIVDAITGGAGEKPDTSEIKSQIDDYLGQAKEHKGDLVKKITEALSGGNIEIPDVDAGAEVQDMEMIYTDEKDGYSCTMDIVSKANVEGVEAEANGKLEMTVKSSSDVVKAPESATPVKDIVTLAYGLFGSVLSSTSLY